jgi:hypothetical protein
VTSGRSLVSLVPPVSSTNRTDRHDIIKILLKVALNNIKPIIPKPHLIYQLIDIPSLFDVTFISSTLLLTTTVYDKKIEIGQRSVTEDKYLFM